MSEYVKQVWVDGVTPADAEHFNHMEDGIAANAEAAVELSKKFEKLTEEVSGEIRITDWTRGAFNSNTGKPTETLLNQRLRSDFIACKKGDTITSSGDVYFYVYFYDADTLGFTANNGEWVQTYTLTSDATVRILAKMSSSGADSTGYVITDEMLAEFVIEIKREESGTKEKIEQLPTLALEGDTSAMTKDDSVTLNYTIFGQAGTCTCKWQGSSSVRYAKKNYTINFDTGIDGWAKWAEFVNAQRAANGNFSSIPVESRWGTQTKFCIKANWIDPSHARNVVNARLWGQIVRNRISKGEITDNRTIAPNYGAIDGFPIEITINGESMGLYTFNIPKDGWQFAMGDVATEYIISGEDNSLPACRWKALAELNEEDFGLEYAADGVGLATVKASLNTAIQAAIDAGEEWETTLAPYVDINSVFDYFIFTCCINNYDALSRNILYGTYDGVKWFMSAYDMDATHGCDPYGSSWYTVETGRTEFAAAKAIHRLAYLMYTYSKSKLVARYKELREGILSEENVWHEFSQFIVDISSRNYDVDRKIWSAMPGTALANISQYMNYYRMHCSLLDKEIEALSNQ